jgi:hypothetical protein
MNNNEDSSNIDMSQEIKYAINDYESQPITANIENEYLSKDAENEYVMNECHHIIENSEMEYPEKHEEHEKDHKGKKFKINCLSTSMQ